jgi:hypothetical protein
VDYDWVQLNGVNETGYFAKPGFSGSPVWDEFEKGVVGITVGRDREEKVRVAFVIPTELLVEAWPSLSAQLICDVIPDDESHKAKPYVKMQLYIRISLEAFEEDPEKWKKYITERLGLSPEEIEFDEPEPAGSIRVHLRIPKSAADRLQKMALTEDPTLDSLGISYPFDHPGLPDPNDFPSRPRARKDIGMSG